VFCALDRAPLAFSINHFSFSPIFVLTTFRSNILVLTTNLSTQDIAPPDNSSDSSGSSSEAEEEEEDEVFPDFDQMGDDVVGEVPMDNDDAFPDFGEQPEDANAGNDDGEGFGDDDWGSGGGGGFGEETTSEGDAGFGGSFGDDAAFPDF